MNEKSQELIDEIGIDFEQDLYESLNTDNLTILKGRILTIFHKHLDIFNMKRGIKSVISEVDLAKAVDDISNYLIINEAKFKNLDSIKSRANFALVVKKLVIYQMYKILNPKRIAGETQADNFRDNMIVGGIKYAQKYAKMDKGKIQKLTKEFSKQIEKSRNSIDQMIKR